MYLLDIGVEVNIILEVLVYKLGVAIISLVKLFIRIASGYRYNFVGIVENVRVVIGGISYLVTFFVLYGEGNGQVLLRASY